MTKEKSTKVPEISQTPLREIMREQRELDAKAAKEQLPASGGLDVAALDSIIKNAVTIAVAEYAERLAAVEGELANVLVASAGLETQLNAAYTILVSIQDGVASLAVPEQKPAEPEQKSAESEQKPDKAK